MKMKIKCIFLVHLVNVASGSMSQLKFNPSNYGDWVRPDDEMVDPPKVTLVKRIVPHGYKSPPIEYDSKFDTIFVPKFRVEKRVDLNTMKSELASKEMFLQPFKAFPGQKENQYSSVNIDSLLKSMQNTRNEEPLSKPEQETIPNLSPIFMSFKTYANRKKIYKPVENISSPLNAFRNREYEKPWRMTSQPGKKSEMKSKTLSKPKGIRQNKHLEYYKHLETLVKSLENLYSEDSKKTGMNLDGILWNNIGNHSKQKQTLQAAAVIDDILKDLQDVENDKTRHRSHQSDNSELYSAESLFQPVNVLLRENEKQKDITNLDSLLQALQSLESAELRQNLENYSDKKENVNVVKLLDALMKEMNTENSDLMHKKKGDVKKLLFKSFKSYYLNKNDLLSQIQTLRHLKNADNKPSQPELLTEVNSDVLLWEPIKVPKNNLHLSNDLDALLNEMQKPTVDPQSGVASSDELWKPLNVPTKKTNVIASADLNTILKQLRNVENGKVILKNYQLDNSAESIWPPKKNNQEATDLEMLIKTLKEMKDHEHNLKSNVVSDEIPRQPKRNLKKQYLEALDAELGNKDEKQRKLNKDTFILYPNKNNKVQVIVRSLADLLKVWEYIDSKKYVVQPLLRERGTQNVELDVEKHKPKHPFNFPHYSLWNFWTYDKTLLQDTCPGEQVKVGNVCIWTPPHRK